MEQFYLVGIKILSKACNDLFKMAAIMHRVGDMQSGLPEFSGMERFTQDRAIEHINILSIKFLKSYSQMNVGYALGYYNMF